MCLLLPPPFDSPTLVFQDRELRRLVQVRVTRASDLRVPLVRLFVRQAIVKEARYCGVDLIFLS